VLLVTASLLMLATMSIEPIVTVYVQQLTADATYVSVIAGVIMAVAAVGSGLSAPRLGKLADRAGHARVIVGCLVAAGLLLVAQAAVTNVVQLGILRFLMGLSLGGLLPCVTAAIRHLVDDGSVGRVLGFSVSAQYVGQVLGPLAGGFVGAYVGLRPVFVATGVILLAAAAGNYLLAVTSSANRRK
jgi:MFS family permease